MRIKTATPAPTPIPILAPVERPGLDAAAVEDAAAGREITVEVALDVGV